jgi:23S rRNA pseudouridine2457 synthase
MTNRRLCYAFNKPYAVLSQFSPDGSDKTTLAEFGFPRDVYPIGRLDYDSEGLLLLSNDGSLNKLLLDPLHAHARTYLVQVDNIPTQDALTQLRRGVIIEGRKTLPAKAELLTDEPNLPPRPVPIRFRKNIPTSWIELTISEGKNRQVRKMTAAVGHPTLRLVRIAIGKLSLFGLGLAPGEMKLLSPEEIDTALAKH